MTIEEELMRIEARLWTGRKETYQDALDDDCLVAFTRMSGVSSREAIAESVSGGPRWHDLRTEIDGVLRPTEDVALLTYHAHARRGDGERYSALVSSGYVRRNGDWKLMFHQQTPLEEVEAGTA